MNTLTEEQLLFLGLIMAGKTLREAGAAVGKSKSIAWSWAANDPHFAAEFRKLHPTFGKMRAQKHKRLAAISVHIPASLTLHQLAMQRLERELRADGPYAVLAAAAIVLVSPQDTPEDAPVSADETLDDADGVSDELQLLSLRSETSSMALSRMLNEVFPLNAPCTYSTDVGHVRNQIEQHYNCNLEVELQSTSKSISNLLRRHLTKRFTVVFQPHVQSHGARIYSVPQPVTLL